MCVCVCVCVYRCIYIYTHTHGRAPWRGQAFGPELVEDSAVGQIYI